MRNLRTLRSHTAVTRAIRFLPLSVFLVVASFLGFSVQAVQPHQDPSFSLEASLQETQTRYEAALRDSHSKYASFFEKAYQAYPVIPKGVLEAVSYAETEFNYLIPSEEKVYPSYGLMGLRLNGQGVFNDNLILVSDLSGYSVDEIKYLPELHIMAFATAYVALKTSFKLQAIELRTISQY